MKIAIAGMGLIGGSFYKALRLRGYCVKGFDKGDNVDLAGAGLVIVALAPDTAVAWIEENRKSFGPGCVVVDTCGIKGDIVSRISSCADSWFFVGGHPMAGKEVSGFENSDEGLFKGASMILTPLGEIPKDIRKKLEKIFTDAGFARIVETTPQKHDMMIAFTSQLCHIISSAYLRDPLSLEHAGFSAGSFRDLTRVGAPDPALWAELFIKNREELLPVLDRFMERMGSFRSAIAREDFTGLSRQLCEGRDVKKKLHAQEDGQVR